MGTDINTINTRQGAAAIAEALDYARRSIAKSAAGITHDFSDIAKSAKVTGDVYKNMLAAIEGANKAAGRTYADFLGAIKAANESSAAKANLGALKSLLEINKGITDLSGKSDKEDLYLSKLLLNEQIRQAEKSVPWTYSPLLKGLSGKKEEAFDKYPLSGIEVGINKFIAGLTAADKVGEKITKTLSDGLETLGTAAVNSIFDGAEFRADELLRNMAKQFLQIAINSAVGSIFENVFGLLFHQGGVVGAQSGGTRAVSPAVFAYAPRYHGGGVAGLRAGEVPAILQRGEGIFTAAQMRALSPASSAIVNLDVIDQRGVGAPPVEVEQTPSINGGVDIKLLIRGEVLNTLGTGAADSVMRNRYAMRPMTMGR